MQSPSKIVISASRRTDIPAFYMTWFMERVEKGFFKVINPYNSNVSVVPASPDKVHTIVFWSKNFGPFIKGGFGEKLLKMGYNLFFNFTVNSENRLLEPNVPPLKERFDQVSYLCNNYDAKHINWRFDPVCYYSCKNKPFANNMDDFSRISDWVANSGITRCITSFMDHYPKIQKRVKKIQGFSFIDPPMEKQREIILKMEKALNKVNIKLYTCCEKALVDSLGKDSNVTNSSCISNRLFATLFGGELSFKPDKGQRVKNGCKCMVSSDIGSYNLHPCFHNCLFCYANPATQEKERYRK